MEAMKMGGKMDEHAGAKKLESTEIRRAANGFVVRVGYRGPSKEYPSSMDCYSSEEHVFDGEASMAAFIAKMWGTSQA